MKRIATSALLLMGCAVGTTNDQKFGAGNDAGSGSFGNGKVVKTFGDISAGWSGAGVTTKAPISVLPN